MDYQQALDFLYHSLPMFSRNGKQAIKPGLRNISELCSYLDHPQYKFKTIHVAGTNGKGSVCHMLASIFASNGYKTGLYTSPHLKNFGERIKINGEMISPQFVIDFVEKTKPFTEKYQPSFFEITVGMALDYFATEQVDLAVIETGLGGRLDSTNIILPVLSVITNIGMDHKEILGDTLAKIAAEKAGIIKSGIPVVIGEYLPETKPVFDSFALKNASPMSYPSDRYTVLSAHDEDHLMEVEIFDHDTQRKEEYHLDLTGTYQQLNLVTVLGALDFLSAEFSLNREEIKKGLSAVKELTGLHGRWEVINTCPKIVLDVAHNAEGMRQLLNQISLENYDRLFIIIGMVKDKAIDEVLMQMPAHATYFFTNAHIPRALEASELQRKASEYLLTGRVFSDVNLALQTARKAAAPNDLIVICGSIFVIGEVERNFES